MVTAHQRTAESIPDGEYLIRLLAGNASQRDRLSNPLLKAQILEGDHDGRRIVFDLAPSAVQGIASTRLDSFRLGACYMVKVAARTDGAGRRRNVITALFFLGFEPSSTSETFSLN
jgi:hypothetical protein